MKYWVIFVFFIMIQGVYASEYNIQFNQSGDSLIVKEGNLMSFVASEGLDKTNSGYYFIKKIEAMDNYTNFSVRLDLEEGVVANSEEIFPVNYISVSDGQTIGLVWNYHNVSKGDVFAFFVSLNDVKRSSNYNWIYFILAILVLFLFGFFGARYFIKKKRGAAKYLLDDEKKVIKLIGASDGSGIWQKNIQSSLGFSKAKLSRMIRNLESRGLIEKIPIGNTNKIKLK